MKVPTPKQMLKILEIVVSILTAVTISVKSDDKKKEGK